MITLLVKHQRVNEDRIPIKMSCDLIKNHVIDTLWSIGYDVVETSEEPRLITPHEETIVADIMLDLTHALFSCR